MYVRLGDIRRFIVCEYALSNSVTLYHRSKAQLKPGDILTSQKDDGKHWLADKRFEQELEEYRRENYPSLPSRFDCVYASLVPRSRFTSKGDLYAVQPLGVIHVTDSTIIDEIGDLDAGDETYLDEMEQYWEGVEPNRGNLTEIEVLMSSAKVIEKIDEPTRLQVGMKFLFGSESPVMTGHIQVWGTSRKSLSVLSSDDATKLPYVDAIDLLNVKGVNVSRGVKKVGPHLYQQAVNVGPGFKGFVQMISGVEPHKNNVLMLKIVQGDAPTERSIPIVVNEPSKFLKNFRAGFIERR